MNAIDQITGVEDVGWGPVVKLEAVCNKCGSVARKAFTNPELYTCQTCNQLTEDVKHRSLRMFRDETV